MKLIEDKQDCRLPDVLYNKSKNNGQQRHLYDILYTFAYL